MKAETRAKLSAILTLKGEKLQEALRALPKEEYNSLLLFGVIEDLEGRGKPPEVTLEQAEAMVDRELARKLADGVVDDIINNHKDALLPKLDEEYGRSPIVGDENKHRNAEGSLKYAFEYLAFAYEKVLACAYKQDEVRWIKYADGHRRPVREFRYKCQTKKRNEDNPSLVVEVVPEGNRLAVMAFRMLLSPRDYPSTK
ncbi:MAG TPA: hypothetical protein VGW12_03855 [Pyrinomonadaceae bacterium]|nr:hypothetical protein [Pyrinomonadaceae bacterium]